MSRTGEAARQGYRPQPCLNHPPLRLQVKEDNARIQVIDRALKLAEDDNIARRKAIQEATAEIEERRGDAGDSSKYEMLFKRGELSTRLGKLTVAMNVALGSAHANTMQTKR